MTRGSRGAGQGEVLTQTFPSPLGTLVLAATERGIRALSFGDEEGIGSPAGHRAGSRAALHLARAAAQLAEYFTGSRRRFDLPLDLEGQGTPFQRAVWLAIASIPYGQVRSYAAVAASAGHPRAARAAGQAARRNPLAILIPCHRVVGSSGALTGFGGGLWRKEWLLQWEQGHCS